MGGCYSLSDRFYKQNPRYLHDKPQFDALMFRTGDIIMFIWITNYMSAY